MTSERHSNGQEPGVHDRPEQWLPRLSRLLGDQSHRYGQLQELAAIQSRCIEADETDELLATLARRQVLLDEIIAANEAIEPFRRSWDALVNTLNDSQRESLRQLVDQIDAKAMEVMACDERDRKALERRRAVITAEMTETRNSRHAMAAYAGSGAVKPPKFQDRTG